MRPQKFSRLMDAEFETALRSGRFEPAAPLRREMLRVWERLAKRDGDMRTGEETYGYGDPEKIRDDLLYISDRWRCAFRLRWLIDMPKREG